MPDVQDALDPSAGPSNSQQNQVTCTRDLENFTRLWTSIKGLNQAISSGQITVGLEWHSNTGDAQNGWGSNDGAPAINVYLAAPNHSDITQDGTLDYLTDAATAADQLSPYGFALGTVAKGQPFYFPADAFTTLSDTNPLAYFLFEGVARGKGRLVVTFNSGSPGSYTKICEGGSLYLDLKNIKELYERWTVGDENGGAPAATAGISPDRLPAGVQGLQYSSGDPGLAVPSDPNGNKYILFVHGWNLAPWEKDAFAETAFKRLYWQGYKGKFGTFQWPTTYHNLDIAAITDYDPGEFSAWRSGPPLEQLLMTLHGAYSNGVYVLAHSMGNIVAGEALRIAGQSGAGQLVNTYVATQAAVQSHCYDPNQSTPDNWWTTGGRQVYGITLPDSVNLGPDTPNIYNNWFMSTGSGVAARSNFYNTNDFALSRNIWETDQVLKPDLIGASPPYGYNGDPNSPPVEDDFYNTSDDGNELTHALHLGDASNVRDRYEIMAFAAEPRCRALGTTPDAAGLSPQSLTDGLWPVDTFPPTNGPYSSHPWHSAQFRFTNAEQKDYWHALLGPNGFNLTPP